jgi:integrase
VNFDLYFTIRYKVIGKEKSEGLGWSTEGWTEKKAAAVLAELKANQTTGQGPVTLSEKREIKQAKEAAKAAEELRIKNRWTIQKLWEAYTSQLSKGANRTDKSFYRNYLEKSFGPKEPRQLVKLDTDRLRINLLKKKSPQTVKHVLALLRRIINFGVNQGYIPPLPFKIAFPSVDNIKTEDLTPEQLQRLVTVLDSTSLTVAATMMKLALYTGMRRGEIFKLQWNDLDFHREFIHIREPKGGTSQKIPMNSNAKEILQRVQETDSEYLFPARNGGPRKDISKDARAIKEAARLPVDFRPFHGLRHLYATMLASSGKVDMFTLQKLLTHKSPQMTLRYAHFRDDAMKRAANEVDDILSTALDLPKKKSNQA